MKRRKPFIDTRLSWRNPSMPVIDESGREINHTKITLKAQLAMQSANEPTWRDDPTYNLRKVRR